MRKHIARVLCLVLLVQLMFASGVFIKPEQASAAEPDGAVVLINEDFTKYDEGTTAQFLGFTYTAPLSGTGKAAVSAINGQKGLHLGLTGGTGNTSAQIRKSFAAQKGTIVAEYTYMPTEKKANDFMQLVNSENLRMVVVGMSNSGLQDVPNDQAQGFPAPYNSFNANTWYSIKTEYNLISRRYNVYVDGNLVVSRREINNSRNKTEDISSILFRTPNNSGGALLGKLKVTALPSNYVPKAPEIINYVSRDREVGIYFESVTSATYYNIRTRPVNAAPEDIWYIGRRHTGGTFPTERNSALNYAPSAPFNGQLHTGGDRLINGIEYYISVQPVMERVNPLNTAEKTYYPGEEAIFRATPNAFVPIASPADSIIGEISLWASYYAANWKVSSNIQPGDNVYNSSNYEIASIPDKYKGLDWIKTDFRSHSYADKAQLATFPVKDNSTVYVAMDARATKRSWITEAEGWTDTGEVIQLSNGTFTYPFKVYKKQFTSGSTVTMGLNFIDPVNPGASAVATEIASGASLGYFVMAERSKAGLQTASIPEWTNLETLTVSGSVQETPLNFSVFNNGAEVHNAVLTEADFTVPVQLVLGANEIELKAQRASSALADSIMKVVHYDPVAPVLSMNDLPSESINHELVIAGTVNEIAKVFVTNNGTTVINGADTDGVTPFSQSIRLFEGSNQIVVTAVDRAGNQVSKTFEVEYVFWAGEAEFVDFNGNKATSLAANEGLIAEKTITNTTDSVKQIAIFMVLYDSNNKMVDFSIALADYDPGETKTLSTGFVLPANVKGYSVKAFIWDNLNDMKPLSNESLLK